MHFTLFIENFTLNLIGRIVQIKVTILQPSGSVTRKYGAPLNFSVTLPSGRGPVG